MSYLSLELLCISFSGLLREPKWGHLRDLHAALKLCKKALFKGNPSVETFGEGLEVSHHN